MRRRLIAIWALTSLIGGGAMAQPARQDGSTAAMAEGNFADALRIARQRLDAGEAAPEDLERALDCLLRLNRVDEFDAIVESAVDRYAGDPAMLLAASRAYARVPSYGHLVAGEFRRGNPRGAAEQVSVQEADRVQSLRLALAACRGAGDDDELAADAAELLAATLTRQRTGQQAWRLQKLTDLGGDLPEPDPRWGGAPSSDPPVAPDGEGPLLYDSPDSWADARNDGERYRWALAEQATRDPEHTRTADLDYARFLLRQFGVQSLRQSGWFAPRDEDDPLPETSALAVETLSDDETIARLATGVKRFTLPEGHRFIELFRKHAAWDQLFEIHLNRNQRSRAIEVGQEWLTATDDDKKRERITERLDQLTRPWARFEITMTQPADAGAELTATHRNAARIELVARPVDVARLLADLRQRIAAGMKTTDWRSRDVENLGWRLVRDDPDEYLGDPVAKWETEVVTPEDHADAQASITTPLQTAGAYFVTATSVAADGARGAETNVVAWVADTVLLRKPTETGALYQTLDARTGLPVEEATVDLFGYRRVGEPGLRPRIETQRVAERTDADGLAKFNLAPSEGEPGYDWLSVATTDDGRLAHLGFSSVWRSYRNDSPPDAPRTFVVTDRPVYRPGDTVDFKAWVGKPNYLAAADPGEPEPSEFAHQEFQVDVYDARGEKVDTQRLTADLYGGVVGDYTLPAAATLGVFRIDLVGFGGSGFRVEEYRKPEFEVVVEAPDEPTPLGEAFEATVRAAYYAGTPVRGGRLAYKVTRTRRVERWLPPGPWDWLYGRGYGWLGQDATWRKDWGRWGCFGPLPPWLPRNPGPPEVVAEGEAELDADGVFRLRIDTATAAERQPDSDHEYQITAEVTDAGRRTITGEGSVLAARRPVEVTVWLDRGFYDVGDTVEAQIAVRRPDGEPAAGTGELRLLKIAPATVEQAAELVDPEETLVQSWSLPTDDSGAAKMRLKASDPGRYRLTYCSNAADTAVEGGLVFTIRGPGFESSNFRYGDLELVPDRSEYRPGEPLRLLINADRRDAFVTLFVRCSDGVYPAPETLRLDGKSTVVELSVTPRDLPNFFVETHTVVAGRLETVTRQIVVPPESRVLNVEAEPSATTYLPGEEGKLRVRLTDESGEPVIGQATIAVYDRSVEAIAGGPVGGDIRERFWDWKRSHQPSVAHNFDRTEGPVVPPGAPIMQPLGVFGEVARGRAFEMGGGSFGGGRGEMVAFGRAVPSTAMADGAMEGAQLRSTASEPGGETVAVREDFADTALWVGAVETDADGQAEVAMPLPESLTAWKVRAWAVAGGLRVGQGEAEVVTRKELMVRLRTPRFLVAGDESVFAALVQNESPKELAVRVRLEVEGDALATPSSPERTVTVPAGGEALVDWRVTAASEGDVKLRVVATTDGAASLSDGVQVELPVLVHGAEIVDSFSAVIAPGERLATFELIVPEERRPEATRLEVRYSPTLVGSMLDALPYLIEYPHGCTEQTLNRFLPAAIVRKTLEELNVELADLKPDQPAAGPPRRNDPVFDREELDRITRAGVTRLMQMQLADGGWGWFSGWGERSTPHTTAVVVRGLALAREAGVAVPDDVLQRGAEWLAQYRAEQLERLANMNDAAEPIDDARPAKRHADNLDALVELTLGQAGRPDEAMLRRLFEDRLQLAPYSLATLGLALHLQAENDEFADLRDRVIENLKQYVQNDDENQTAYLNLPGGSWWYWYGSEYEAHAYFLKLLAATEPRGELAPRLVKYLLANRRHATRWNSTRDTSLVVEAMADYVRASGEAAAEGTVEVWLDGKLRETRAYDAAAALRLDGRFTLVGEALPAGRHTLELRKQGDGRLYAGASLTNFSLEDDLRAAGLEVRVRRRVQKLIPIEATGDDVDARGALFTPKVERYRRVDVPNLGVVESGDLVEVELTIASKNDYEYLILEDPKPAGFEPVESRSGYNGNAIGAYVEYRDERVLFYARTLARGERTVTYRLRAETPGRYAALPAVIRAMYAPELRGNSDEIKLRVEDAGE